MPTYGKVLMEVNQLPAHQEEVENLHLHPIPTNTNTNTLQYQYQTHQYQYQYPPRKMEIPTYGKGLMEVDQSHL